MSSSESDFARWLSARFAETQGFTALILLVAFRERVEMLSCSYLHVIGDEIDWPEMKRLIDQSGQPWDAVAIFAEADGGGGPVADILAAPRQQDRIDAVTADRMVLNEAGLFDRLGRAVRIDPVTDGRA